MRLEAVAKMGYYPCPPHTLEMISCCLRPAREDAHIRILDPCAGQGEAIARIGPWLYGLDASVTSCGVELSDQRYAIARHMFDHCIHADWFDVAVSHNSQSLLWLNPPYSAEEIADGEKKQQLEYTFLRDSLRTLQPGGVLVYIVPLHIFQQPAIAKFVAGHFHQVRLFRMPDGEWEQFRQCVVFGIRNDKIVANESRQKQLMEYARGGSQVLVLGHQSCLYHVPATMIREDKFIFRKITLRPNEVIELVAGKYHAHAKKEWQDLTTPQGAGTFQPVVPLRVGHVASMISSGMMGTVRLGNMLAKGRTVKTIEHVDADGTPIPANQVSRQNSDEKVVVRERERFNSTVTTLRATGEHAIISTPDELEAFMRDHAGDIARVLQQKYQPLYEAPTDEEWRVVSGLMKAKRLPGRKAAGMLPAQKHVSIAASRVVRKLGYVDLACMMGTGKSLLSLATIELLGAYPSLVVCPTLFWVCTKRVHDESGVQDQSGVTMDRKT